MARIYDAKGDTTRAVQHFRWFVELLRNGVSRQATRWFAANSRPISHSYRPSFANKSLTTWLSGLSTSDC